MKQFLIDFVNGYPVSIYRNFFRIDGVFPRKVFYPGIQRGAEQHGLPVFRFGKHSKKAAQVGIKPHVEHAIRFINNQETNRPQLHDL